MTDWTSLDASVLRDMLGTDTFKKALQFVAEQKPELLDGADVNKTLVRSGVVKGFDLAFSTLFDLTSHKPEVEAQTATEYPNLDDDSKWEQSEQPTK